MRSLNSSIAAAERLINYRVIVNSSGKSHLDNKIVDKGKDLPAG